MGSAVSVVLCNDQKTVAVVTDRVYLSSRQKYIVRKTWRYFSNDMTSHGTQVFLRIFTLNPKMKELFRLSDLNDADIIRDQNFRSHGSRFMQSVGAVVDHLEDLESLKPLLHDLGERHTRFHGFTPIYFHSFSEAMCHVWQQELGERYTEEVAQAWQTVFAFIMDTLKEGYMLETQKLNQQRAKLHSPAPNNNKRASEGMTNRDADDVSSTNDVSPPSRGLRKLSTREKLNVIKTAISVRPPQPGST